MTVKIFDSNKLEELLSVERRCFEDEAWSEAMFKESMLSDGMVFFGAFVEEKLVGYLALKVCFEIADLEKMCVLPAFQQLGMGLQLIKNATDYAVANGVEKIFLEVNEQNVPAISLYQKSGFRREGVRKNYYNTKRFATRDAIVMSKTLCSA